MLLYRLFSGNFDIHPINDVISWALPVKLSDGHKNALVVSQSLVKIMARRRHATSPFLTRWWPRSKMLHCVLKYWQCSPVAVSTTRRINYWWWVIGLGKKNLEPAPRLVVNTFEPAKEMCVSVTGNLMNLFNCNFHSYHCFTGYDCKYFHPVGICHV